MRALSSIGALMGAMMAGQAPRRRASTKPALPAYSARGLKRQRLKIATAMRVRLEQKVEQGLRARGIWRLEEPEALAAFKQLPTVEALVASAGALAKRAA